MPKAYILRGVFLMGKLWPLGRRTTLMYLHGVNGSTPYELFAVFDKHESPIRCLDFSADSSMIRAVDALIMSSERVKGIRRRSAFERYRVGDGAVPRRRFSCWAV